MHPATELLECASCGVAEFAFDGLTYTTNNLAECGAFLTSDAFQRRIADTPATYKAVNTVLWNRGTAYALHDDLVSVGTVVGGDASQADPVTVTFPLCKLCDEKHGAGTCAWRWVCI